MSSSASLANRIGAQRPRVHHIPPGRVSSAGEEAIALAASVGLYLDDWQQWVLDNALSQTEFGRWCATQVGLIVPRQAGKGSVLEALELAWLFLFGAKLIVHSAHKFDTAQEHYQRLRNLIQNSHLDRHVASMPTANGKEAIILKSGARLKFIARSRGGARGFTGDLIVLDEAYDLSAAEVGAMLPALSARSMKPGENPQIWFTSSAPHPDSTVLHDVRTRGMSDDQTLKMFFAEWGCPVGADINDRDNWYEANPALGIRISEEWIADTELRVMSPEEFGRERLGIAPPMLVDEVDELAQLWQRLADPQSQPEGRVAFALSVSPNGNSAAIAVAGVRADGLEHIEIAYHDQGTGWVIDEVLAMAARNDGFVLAVPASGPAGPVVAMLEREGVTVVAAKTTDASNACGGLLIAARDGRLRHRGQRSLDVAVAGAKRKEIGDSWVWGRKTSTSDVSPLEAVTLARWALGSVSEKPAPLVFAY